MAENKCTGECIKCSFQQQTYCAAQRGYAIMSYMPAIIERLDAIENSMLKGGEVNPLAQESVGAENRTQESIK